MKKENPGKARMLLAAYGLWTAAVCLVDVQSIGPQGTAVGFARMNRLFHDFTGVHMPLYILTDWLSLVPLSIALGFALLGLYQWISRRNIRKVDTDILLLGGFYGVVMGVYALFEVLVVNYRPILIQGMLEASYPSSTTVLVLCVMGTAEQHLRQRISNSTLRKGVMLTIRVFTCFMVAGRLFSGVHWLTDIIAGALLSAGLVKLYGYFVSKYKSPAGA